LNDSNFPPLKYFISNHLDFQIEKISVLSPFQNQKVAYEKKRVQSGKFKTYYSYNLSIYQEKRCVCCSNKIKKYLVKHSMAIGQRAKTMLLKLKKPRPNYHSMKVHNLGDHYQQKPKSPFSD
jgi:hypothetical protein